MLRSLCLLVPLSVLFSCSNDDGDSTDTTDRTGATDGTDAAEQGARIWVHNEPESDEGLEALIIGELQHDEVHDCLLVTADGGTYPVVWPSATESLADTIGVQLPSGDRATEGDIISGGGGYLDVADEYGIPAECRPATGDVAVFNPTEPVEVNTAAGG